MRILIAFFLLTFFEGVVGQTTPETLIKLENRANVYLIQMYVEKNFNEAYKKWSDVNLNEVKEIYKNRNKLITDRITLIETIRSDYKKFYLNYKNFVFIEFVDKKLDKEGSNTIAYFEYSFKEDFGGKSRTDTSFLYFVFDNHQSEWEIIDFRVPEIIGDSTIWMK